MDRCKKCNHPFPVETAAGDFIVCEKCHTKNVFQLSGQDSVQKKIEASAIAADPPESRSLQKTLEISPREQLEMIPNMMKCRFCDHDLPEDTVIGNSIACPHCTQKNIFPTALTIIPMLNLDKTTESVYELSSSPLGSGGMGVVYRAKQTSLKREIVLKTAINQNDQTVTEALANEALITGHLIHPNIVAIYDAGVDKAGRTFYIMEKAPGVPWKTLLHPETPEEKGMAVAYKLNDHIDILQGVLNAMAAAHEKNIIHRDLKPNNIMVGSFGEVTVIDWGLAVSLDGKLGKSFNEETTGAGTPQYMAPEMALGDVTQIGRHSDIYLIGAILYEILTGFPPHPGNSRGEIIKAAQENKIVPPVDKTIDWEILMIAAKAMATNPRERYASAQEFQEALKRWKSHAAGRELVQRAREIADLADKNKDYRLYAQALGFYDEAKKTWA
jgi:Zn finger protein HypA/HybF involved in hydrogenase expression